MKIQEFEIRNFKSFADYDNPVVGRVPGLGKLNMIYGDNSSGKSNILKFISLIFSSKFQTGEPILVEGLPMTKKESKSFFWKGIVNKAHYIFHKNDRSLLIKFYFVMELTNQEIVNSGFQGMPTLIAEYGANAVSSIIRFEGQIQSRGDLTTSDMVLKKVELNNRELFLDNGVEKYYFRSGQGPQALLTESLQFENFMSILNGIVLFLDTDRFFTDEHEDTTIKGLAAKNFKNWLHNLSLEAFGHKKYLQFIEFVKQQHSLGSFFQNFNPSFSRHDSDIEVMLTSGDEKFPLENYGTGIQQILYLLSIIFESKARIILIEELELNLSPKAQKKVFQVLRQLISNGIIDQVIFTTHSPYFKFTTDFCFFEVSMNHLGVTKVEKVAAVRRSFFVNNPMA